jgi:hypothetical protein
MSGVSKLGNNRYLATSKNVNRVLNQLNGILANDNITVQNVNAVAGGTVTISLTNGNFINLSIPASGKPTIAFTNLSPGIYYIIFTNASSGVITAPVYAVNAIKTSSFSNFSTSNNAISTSILICDGTTLYEIQRTVGYTNSAG